jgi:hypothetical protein
METEEWRTILEAPRYVVSNFGRVANSITGRIMKTSVNSDGYPNLSLTIISPTGNIQINRSVHRLVAVAFLPTDDFSLEVNHKDGIKTNNVVWNLEWNTRSQNQRHAFETGLFKRGGGKIRIIETGEVFETQKEVADAVKGSQAGVSNVLLGKWSQHNGYTFEYV